MSLVASVRRQRRKVGRLLLLRCVTGATALGTLTLPVALPIATGPTLAAVLLVTAGGGAALSIRSPWQGAGLRDRRSR